MKKFRYNMESILQIKQKLEEQAKIAYANMRAILMQEEEKLEALKLKEKAYEEDMKQLRSAKLDILKIKECEQAIEVTKMYIKQQIIVVKNAEHRLEIARIRLNDAMVERKTQEKLKEKAFEEYLLEFDSEERKEVDELNSFRYNFPELHEEDS